MEPDPREVCVCFHVSLDKLAKFCRLNKPAVASEMHRCFNAGTGCGWCVPYLQQIHEQCARGDTPRLEMEPGEYWRRREAYRAEARPNLTASPRDEDAIPMNLESVLEAVPDSMKLEES